MEVELIRDHYGVPEGEVYPKNYRAGAIVTGQLAESALEMGDGVLLGKKPTAPRETSSASQPAPVSPEPTAKKRRGRPRKSSQ
jgi:hypothetical protein